MYVCANFYFLKNHTRILKPDKIITCGDKKVAFIGVVTPLTMSKTYLSTIKMKMVIYYMIFFQVIMKCIKMSKMLLMI